MSILKEYAQKYNSLSDNNQYKQIPLIKNEWKILRDSTEINTYLPPQNKVHITTGIKTKRTTHLNNNFESIDLSQSIKNKRGYILNTGISIWALEFIPKPATLDQDPHIQYLAIGGYNSIHEHYTMTDNPPVKNSIQIYQTSSDTSPNNPPKLDLCILHDFGVIVDFKWCPYSVYNTTDKLGIVAILLGNGQIKVLVVPHPQHIRNQEKNISTDETIYLKVEKSRLDLNLPRTYYLCMSWGNYKNLACGTKSGSIVVWNILDSLLTATASLTVNIHNASLVPIRNISWISLLDHHQPFFISSDADGTIFLHDLNDPFINMKMFRIRCTYVAVEGIGSTSQFVFGDYEGVGRLNTALNHKKSVTLTMHNGLIWSLAITPQHGIAVSAASTGTVKLKLYANEDYALNHKHKLNVLEHTLYKLVYDEQDQTYTFMDGFKPKTDLPDRIFHEVFIHPIVSIHKVAWNNNKNASGWIVSGGKSGLCRLEFTGC